MTSVRGVPPDRAAPTAAGGVSSTSVLDALRLVRRGRVHSLALPRFPGMPLWPGHPAFEVLTYRSPQGLRAAGVKAWPGENEAGLGYIAETVSGTVHSGAHIDAHAHMTIGDDDHWYGGSAQTDLGDFGPLKGDASELQPIVARGVLYDVPRHRGCAYLPKAEPVTAAELRAIGRSDGIREPGPGDVVLIRTGYLHHWPDPATWRNTADPARTSPRRTGSSSAACTRPAPTPRRTRYSRRPSADTRPTRNQCTPGC